MNREEGDVDRLVKFFRSPEGAHLGREGDSEGLTPCEMAVKALERFTARERIGGEKQDLTRFRSAVISALSRRMESLMAQGVDGYDCDLDPVCRHYENLLGQIDDSDPMDNLGKLDFAEVEKKIMASLLDDMKSMARATTVMEATQRATPIADLTVENQRKRDARSAKLWLDLLELVGHWQEGTNDVVTLYQDEATQTCHIRVGKKMEYASSFEGVMQKINLKGEQG